MEEIKYLSINFSSHIIEISELRCTDGVPDSSVHIHDYILIQNDKGLINLDSNRDTMRGGVAVYIHKLLIDFLVGSLAFLI